MVPWCGRDRPGPVPQRRRVHQLPLNAPPHAIHGTGRDTAWRTRPHASRTEAAFTYDLADPWPYEGRVTQIFELAADALTLTMGVETYGDSFPAQAGWHPWFLRNLGDGGADVGSTSPPEWQEERGEDHLPTGRASRRSPARGTTASACRTASTSP